MSEHFKAYLIIFISGGLYSLLAENIWIGVAWVAWWVFVDLTDLYSHNL